MMHKLTHTANRNTVLIINYACNLESKTKNNKIKRERKKNNNFVLLQQLSLANNVIMKIYKLNTLTCNKIN